MSRRHKRTYRPQSSERNYSVDKNKNAVLKGGEKIKLRKLVMETAVLLNKLNKIGVEENRKLLIAAYNVGGVLAMKAWADNVIQEFDEKNKENGNKQSNGENPKRSATSI